MNEGNLHKWFSKSKSKDGKSGWVNVVTGGTCASDEPGEGTPKCVSSAKRASMSKAERLSAQRRKKKADPGQQQKSGAAKPTYVSTDKPKKKMKEETIIEADKKGKGSGTKDACYKKVKASAKVWPSAYASGRLVQCRKKGAANYGKSKTESYDYSNWRDEFKALEIETVNLIEPDPLVINGVARVFEANKTKTFRQFVEGCELKYCPKCKKIETRSDCAYGGSYWDNNAKEVSTGEDGSMEVAEDWQKKSGKNPEGGLNEKGRKSYERQNPGSDLKAPSKKVGNPRRKSFCARMKGMKKKLTSKKTASDPDSRINKSLRADIEVELLI